MAAGARRLSYSEDRQVHPSYAECREEEPSYASRGVVERDAPVMEAQ